MRETYNDQERYTRLTFEQLARKDNRSVSFVSGYSSSEFRRYATSPVAIRPSQGSLVYAALLFQGLYYVPQVRRSIARWRPQLQSGGETNTASGEGPPPAAPEQRDCVLIRAQTCSCGRWSRITPIWTSL